ncbi:hypothetical protein [Halalkalicoccus jeotgali]|uniref:Uncharacterized protein n=1 Tax=Halalkalicoccus jeotgali (strain DSM 18796 / CECT 7217 / JCM 14584 / KCTC 4019 / B3) TaxID=795797 RepID=D8J729_HALJB|nr:hypothetical protein [Halalkalicoccus jeotgali]ADJ15982.1 hypothetical protein HacjB3_13005 [Halalkalicoccus jeotgali B3]ELY38078.1 hypothetical protein C497_08209 [Halalkalicoccus jeotgali B3]
MAEPNQQALAEARQYGGTLTSSELLRIIEHHHRSDGRGLDRETLAAYDRAVAEDDSLPFKEGQLRSSIEDTLSTGEGWHDAEAYYRVGDDRVSLFPQRWHDRLGDSDDVREYVAVIEDDTASTDTEPDAPKGGIGTGVPEPLLLDAISVIDGADRDTAKDRLERHRRDGGLVQDADQHPEARVYLTEETSEMRDDWLDY